MENLRNIIESLLFVSEEPLTVDKLKTVIETVDAKEIRANLNSLADHYEARGGGFRLCEVAGGWQLRSRSKYNEYIKRMLQPSPQRLSRPALETLAIVAYNQPIIRADIEHIRGVDCGGMLRQLLERKLIRVLGRKEIPGRPLIYATSKLFLELFELKNLKDLPTPKEIEEITTPANTAPGLQTNAPMGSVPADLPGTPATSNHPEMPAPAPSVKEIVPSSAHAPFTPHGGMIRKAAKFTPSSGSTFAAAPKISTDPNKIVTTPSGISTPPFKIALGNGDKSKPIASASCSNVVKNKEGSEAVLPRADKAKNH